MKGGVGGDLNGLLLNVANGIDWYRQQHPVGMFERKGVGSARSNQPAALGGAGKPARALPGGILITVLKPGNQSENQAFVPAQMSGLRLVKAQRTSGADTECANKLLQAIERNARRSGSDTTRMSVPRLLPMGSIFFNQAQYPATVTVDDEILGLAAQITHCRTVAGTLQIIVVIIKKHGFTKRPILKFTFSVINLKNGVK